MPDTGAPWNIPYVAGTDLVADWPTDSQTLATAIADGLDSLPIRQVVSTTITGNVSIATGGFQNVTGLSASITPASASNKVLVVCYLSLSASTANTILTGVDRGGSLITAGTEGSTANGDGFVRIDNSDGAYGHTTVFLDSPATTSAVTYQAQIRRSSGTAYVNEDGGGLYGGVSTLLLMEVAP